MRVKVNIASDLVVGVSMHHAPFPKAVQISFEGATQNRFGSNHSRHRLAPTVKHRRREIVQKGHDIGPWIPHLTFPMIFNPWYAVIYPQSSCEIKFSAVKVKVNGRPVGCAQIIILPLPMMACGEPLSIPGALPITSASNSVSVGMTFRDLFCGILSLSLSLLIDLAFCWGTYTSLPSGKIPKTAGNKMVGWLGSKHLVDTYFKEAFQAYLPQATAKGVGSWLAKGALHEGADLLVSILQGDPTYEFGIQLWNKLDIDIAWHSDRPKGEQRLEVEVSRPSGGPPGRNKPVNELGPVLGTEKR